MYALNGAAGENHRESEISLSKCNKASSDPYPCDFSESIHSLPIFGNPLRAYDVRSDFMT